MPRSRAHTQPRFHHNNGLKCKIPLAISHEMLQNQAEAQVPWDGAKKPFCLNLEGKAVPPGLGSNPLVGCETGICSGQCNNPCIFTLLLYSLRNNKTKPLCPAQQDFTHRGCALSPASPLTNHLTAARDVTGGGLCPFNRRWQRSGSRCPSPSAAVAFQPRIRLSTGALCLWLL